MLPRINFLTVLCALILSLLLVPSMPPSVADQPAPKPTEAPRKDQMLEAIGTLAASQLYQTYLNIGFLADGVAQKNYEPKEARTVLASVTNSLDLCDKQLANVAKLAANADDRDSLAQLREIADLLRTQGSELALYWDKSEKIHAEKYDAARTKAWAKIKALLALKD